MNKHMDLYNGLNNIGEKLFFILHKIILKIHNLKYFIFNKITIFKI